MLLLLGVEGPGRCFWVGQVGEAVALWGGALGSEYSLPTGAASPLAMAKGRCWNEGPLARFSFHGQELPSQLWPDPLKGRALPSVNFCRWRGCFSTSLLFAHSSGPNDTDSQALATKEGCSRCLDCSVALNFSCAIGVPTL